MFETTKVIDGTEVKISTILQNRHRFGKVFMVVLPASPTRGGAEISWAGALALARELVENFRKDPK